MTIRKRISISLLLIIIIVLPVVAMTLHYFEQMGKRVNAIIRTDARLIDIANSISENMIYAKSAESNFILLQDSLSVLQVQDAVEKILKACSETDKNTNTINVIFRDIAEQTDRYKNSFTSLVEIYREERIQEKFSILHQAFSVKFQETMDYYNELLSEARNESDMARKDTLITKANAYLRSFSIDDLTVDLNTNHEQQLRVISENLSETSDAVLTLAHRLEQETWRSIERHRQTSELLVARAQRNISVVLILTLLLCIYIVVALPQRIIRPITALTDIIKRAEKGDYEVTSESGQRGEVGQLAQFLNRLLRQMRLYDQMKTEKISNQQKTVEELANVMNEGIMILNHELNITLINSALQKTLGWQGEVNEVPISMVDNRGELTSVIQESLETNGDGVSRHVHLQNVEGGSLEFTVRIYPLRDKENIAHTIIVVTQTGR